MKRYFFPVGQGAFYCERFPEGEFGRAVNVVYDCGTISGLNQLKAIVDRTFEAKEQIDALFISHLHEDHINGIPFLMARCRVKRVYLPLMPPIDLSLMRLDFETRPRPIPPTDKVLSEESALAASRFVRNMLENPPKALKDLAQDNGYDTEVVELASASVGLVFPASQTQGVHELSEAILSIESATPISESWCFKTFCIRNDMAVQSVKDNFAATFGGQATPERIAELLTTEPKGKTKKDIRSLYCKIKGKFNSHSLTMYSGSPDLTRRQKRAASCLDDGLSSVYEVPDNSGSGCLYTGDFEASNPCHWDQLKTAYKNLWPNIGCVQVPHHGSYRNFNSKFVGMEAYSVISAGFGNTYHHPSQSVLAKYQRKNRFPFVVSQDPRSMFCTEIIRA